MTGGPGTSSRPEPLPEVTTPRSIVRSASPSPAASGAASAGTDTSTVSISRGTTVMPAWIDAITVAIAIGEASTVPWPIRSAAASVSDAGGGTWPKYAGKPRSWSMPRPRVAAAAAEVLRARAGRAPR